MSGFTEQTFLEAMRGYLATQNTTTTSVSSNTTRTPDIDALVKQLEAMQIKLDKTIEMINGNFKKLNDKVKTLQDDVKKLKESLIDTGS
jgi:peptidoglycan hydrolase CwlO-like protein